MRNTKISSANCYLVPPGHEAGYGGYGPHRHARQFVSLLQHKEDHQDVEHQEEAPWGVTLQWQWAVDVLFLTVSNRQQTDEFELILELVEGDDAGGEEADCVEAVHEDPGHAVPPPPDNIISELLLSPDHLPATLQ